MIDIKNNILSFNLQECMLEVEYDYYYESEVLYSNNGDPGSEEECDITIHNVKVYGDITSILDNYVTTEAIYESIREEISKFYS